jgi:predicted short-subunit dehydrogenase-like oxidoreductase (DUF2520 family)
LPGTRTSDMRWTVVGAGRAGSAVAAWLRASEGTPPAVVGRGRLAPWFARLADEPPGGLILAVPDDALAGVARDLARHRAEWRRWTVLHLSGARDASVLAALRRRGAAVASLHPMMTFPPPSARGKPSPRGVVFTLEGDRAAVQAARRLVRGWGGQALGLSAKAKSAYHLAATLVGPGAVGQMFAAEAILRHYGLRGAQLARARGGLVRLLAATAENLGRMPTAAAWTGPFARGDKATQLLHLRLLPAKLRPLYRALAQTPGPK